MNVVFLRFLSPSGRPRFHGALALFFATFLISLFAGLHPAAALSMGDVFCNVADNVSPFIDVFNMTAYVAGGLFVIQGILHLRHHHDSPREHPHHKTTALLVGGAALTAMPNVVGTLIGTLFGFNGGGGYIGYCSATGGMGGGGGPVPLDVMMTNFIANIKDPLTFLISAVAVTLGVFLIVRGLMKASKYGTDPRTHSISNIITNLVIGTVFVVIGQSVDMIMASVVGTPGITKFGSLAWSGLNGLGDTTHFKAAMEAALTFFQLVGLISFVRGWNIIRNAVEGSGQATVAQGITHIIGGVLAINIYLFMQIMDTTFGTSFVS